VIRKARISDPPDILQIVNAFAARELMLPRSLNDIYEHIRDFFVCEMDGRVVGCVALHVSWEGLGEIRSLAVVEEYQGRGIGAELVSACLDEARSMGISKIFVLTYIPEFFRRLGFRDYPKANLPHKVWSECLKCPKFPNCDEVALLIELPKTP
jgi:amino-acid N-acetyltransferase